ncbi:MAG TPA: ribosome biogenesis factor YjgA [Rhodanobacteraceae bacterium]|nr:ribosome biogenesis factor YjgA [Rhodanobacteraceae bacterium]
MHPADHTEPSAPPSRSQQRRDALAVLDLAGQLVAAPPAQLARMDLPADVTDEVANVRRIKAHGARKRQLAYLAKLMRRHDETAFDAARAIFGEDREQQHKEAAALHRLEALRERLLNDAGDTALGQLIARHPDIDRQHLRALIRRARVERDKDRKPHAQRELFRLLKELPDVDSAE